MPKAESLVVDTHALLWWQAQSARLSATAQAHLDGADRILVSPITCWETATLVRLGRIELDRAVAAWVTDLFADDRLHVASLTPAIAAAAGELGDFHGDPADRLIYATAEANDVPLVTKDDRIRLAAERIGRITTVW